jgi:hypothetical protein
MINADDERSATGVKADSAADVRARKTAVMAQRRAETAAWERQQRMVGRWWPHVLWGGWHGLTAWLVVLVLACGGRRRSPVCDGTRWSTWYDRGFLPAGGTGRSGGTQHSRGWSSHREAR